MKESASLTNPTRLFVLLLVVLGSPILMFSDNAFAQGGSVPQITATTGIQHQVVFLDKPASFTVTASGTAPLSRQWRLDGQDLPGQTNATLLISAARPADEGDYTVVVSNAFGTATNEPPARLHVVTTNQFIKANFTNGAGLRLPYFYKLPEAYDPLRRYPLVLELHGSPQDENSQATVLTLPGPHVFHSYQRQAADPAIVVYPTRRAGDTSWTAAYMQQLSEFLTNLLSRFSFDTNRLYLWAASEGVHAGWDLVALRPGLFAAALLRAGWQGNAPASVFTHLPVWAACARDDEAGQLGNTQNLVRSLRHAGISVIYSEYASGGHLGAILQLRRTPTVIDWFLAQRRNVPATNEPLCTITNPAPEAVHITAAATLNLAGNAAALGERITALAWENTTAQRNGVISVSNIWSVGDIPLAANRTNVIIVTATTTSWAPWFGGNTTFSDTMTVFSSPIRLALVRQEMAARLSWAGGVAPFQVQRATDLTARNWQTILSNAVSPVVLPVDGDLGFFRILGQ